MSESNVLETGLPPVTTHTAESGSYAQSMVHWFNHHRLLGSIGHIPPAEAEANYYSQLAQQTPIAA